MSALGEKDVSRRLPVPDRALIATRGPPWSSRIVGVVPGIEAPVHLSEGTTTRTTTDKRR